MKLLAALKLACLALICGSLPASAAPTKLCRLSDYVFARKWNAATRCANQHGEFAKKLVQWFKYRAAENASFAEIMDFVKHNPKWPDMPLLLANAERAIKPLDLAAILWFSQHEPRTPEGTWFALQNLPPEQARSARWAKRTWVSMGGDEEWCSKFLSTYGTYLSQEDHWNKIRSNIQIGRTVPGWLIAMSDRGWEDVVSARKKLAAGSGNVLRLLDDVPRRLRNEPILLKAAAQWLLKHKEFRALNDLILSRPVPALLQDDWAKIRFIAASELVNEGEFELGYALVSKHQFKDKVNEVDAEMSAGKIAYLHLRDPAKALVHFERMLSSAQMSVSRSKAAYWCYLCSVALDRPDDGTRFLEVAGLYPDNFYGQLALIKLGRPVVEIKRAELAPGISTKLKSSELIAAAKLLAGEGQYDLSRRFMQAAVWAYKDHLPQLAQFASASNIKPLAVMAGKESARRGNFFVEYTYPMLQERVPGLKAELYSLALAIARQESEFHPQARSNKDAMGLMQLIINTARAVARDLGLKRPDARMLATNPLMNVRLGSHHISQLLERYSNCPALAIAAYNAGPTPVERWIQKNGDPRSMSPDEVVMWIEKIPFYETRSYVQHVLSNWAIYKNVLKGKVTRLELS